MTTPKIKPWPGEMVPCECGKGYLVLVNSFGVWCVLCEGCQKSGPKAVDEDQAIATWNKRKP